MLTIRSELRIASPDSTFGRILFLNQTAPGYALLPPDVSIELRYKNPIHQNGLNPIVEPLKPAFM